MLPERSVFRPLWMLKVREDPQSFGLRELYLHYLSFLRRKLRKFLNICVLDVLAQWSHQQESPRGRPTAWCPLTEAGLAAAIAAWKAAGKTSQHWAPGWHLPSRGPTSPSGRRRLGGTPPPWVGGDCRHPHVALPSLLTGPRPAPLPGGSRVSGPRSPGPGNTA